MLARWLVVSCALVANCIGARCQQNTIPTHQHPQPEIIDGKDHPELIPDLTAYRLFLITVARPANASADDRKVQQLQLAKAGLPHQDELHLLSILTNFHAQYQSLVGHYNDEAAVTWARGEIPNLLALHVARDQLVQSTISTMKSSLSPQGWAILDAHVQGEKRNMKIHLEGGMQ